MPLIALISSLKLYTTPTSYAPEHVKGLVTNYGEGGATKREGGHVKFYPYKKEGGKSYSHAEGGAHKVLG